FSKNLKAFLMQTFEFVFGFFSSQASSGCKPSLRSVRESEFPNSYLFLFFMVNVPLQYKTFTL
ncbi:MAG: hypothetical protein NW226_25940, partial [Microscillaceae bacterium]|nr:hypothetical protein [Microscillaceae bacterium]